MILDDEARDEDWPDDDPNDPSHADYDLSEAAGYSALDEAPKPWFLRRWVLMTVAVVVIASLLLPLFGLL